MNFTNMKKFAASIRRKLAAAFGRSANKHKPYFMTEVSPGETIVFSGEVVEGSGLVDESAQVGLSEITLRSAEAGHNQVLAGSVLRTGHLTVKCKQQSTHAGETDIDELRHIILVNLNILLGECAELDDLAARDFLTVEDDLATDSSPSADIVAATVILKQVDTKVLDLAVRFGLAPSIAKVLGESEIVAVQTSNQSLEKALKEVFECMDDATKVRHMLGACQANDRLTE